MGLEEGGGLQKGITQEWVLREESEQHLKPKICPKRGPKWGWGPQIGTKRDHKWGRSPKEVPNGGVGSPDWSQMRSQMGVGPKEWVWKRVECSKKGYPKRWVLKRGSPNNIWVPRFVPKEVLNGGGSPNWSQMRSQMEMGPKKWVWKKVGGSKKGYLRRWVLRRGVQTTSEAQNLSQERS